MYNSTSADRPNQPIRALFENKTCRLPIKIAICKKMKPLNRFIVSALYYFAMEPSKRSLKNRLICGYHYLVRTYGYSKNTFRGAIAEAKQCGFMQGDIGDLSFIDPESIATAERADFPDMSDAEFNEAGIPNFIEVPQIVAGDPDFQKSPLAKVTFGLLWYKVFEDGEIFFTNSMIAKIMGEKTDRIKKHVQKFISKGYFIRKTENGKASRLLSVLNNHKVYEEIFKGYCKATKYNYDTEKLSTGGEIEIKTGELEEQDRGITGSEPGNYGIAAININNNKTRTKATVVAKSTRTKEEPDYVPQWNAPQYGVTNTVPFYGSDDYVKRNINNAADTQSRKRGDALLAAYMASKANSLPQDSGKQEKPVTGAESAFKCLAQTLGCKDFNANENTKE